MAKAKKAKRRMRKAVRKTLGTLLLVSSLLVAAIPVENLQADTGVVSRAAAVEVTNDEIADYRVDSNAKFFATEDSKFRFAIRRSSSGDPFAVILDFNEDAVSGTELVIDNVFDPYLLHPNANAVPDASNLGKLTYVAVTSTADYLYYMKENEYFLCTSTTRGEKDAETGLTVNGEWAWEDTLYYKSGDAYVVASEDQKLHNIDVKYIGDQYLAMNSTGTAWEIKDVTSPNDGVFSNMTQVGSVTFMADDEHPGVRGIGKYGFYGCSSLQSIAFRSSMGILGNGAFEGCAALSSVNFVDSTSSIKTIGANTFKNCTSLAEIVIPTSVTKIGDSAFEGCVSLRKIDLSGGANNFNGLLSTIGSYVFKGCDKLQGLKFPAAFGATNVPLNIVQDCKSLKYIMSANDSFKFDDSGYAYGGKTGYDAFRAYNEERQSISDEPYEFYFAGTYDSELHALAKGTSNDDTFAFRYLHDTEYHEQDKYEKTIYDDTATGAYMIICINEAGEILEFKANNMTTIELPEKIAGFGIKTIGSSTFDGVRCDITTIYLPTTIQTIQDYAFRGCHNLTNVVFKNPGGVTSIGEDAFRTQEVGYNSECSHAESLKSKLPRLTFVGSIGSDTVPFEYAMDVANRINNGHQDTTYVEMYSGWPDNIVAQLQLHEENGMGVYKPTLTNYPTFADYMDLANSWIRTNNYLDYPAGYSEYADDAKDDYAQYGDNYMSANIEQNCKENISSVLNIVIPHGIEEIKDELFYEKEGAEVTGTINKTLIAQGLTHIPDYAFKGCKYITTASFDDGTISVGDYAFEDCISLKRVSFPATLEDMGLRPFKGCTNLDADAVSSADGEFYADKHILYKDNGDNTKTLIEYFESTETSGRQSGFVEPAELAGVSVIAEEAFMETNVQSVDLRKTTITEIPRRAFAYTPKLTRVEIPDTCTEIKPNAFFSSAVEYLSIPRFVTYIYNDAFIGNLTDSDGNEVLDENRNPIASTTSLSTMTFNCEPDSAAYKYATNNNITITNLEGTFYWEVIFFDKDGYIIDTQTIKDGEDATAPEAPVVEGYTFKGWSCDFTRVHADLYVRAEYEEIDTSIPEYTVTFYNWDDTLYMTQTVKEGQDAIPPQTPPAPTEAGYTFTFAGWRPAITNVTENIKTWAQFDKVTSTGGSGDGAGDGSGSGSGDGSGNGNGSGDGTGNGSGSGSGTGDGTGNGNGSGTGDGSGSGSGSGDGTSTNKELYTLTVKNGSGSGSYAEGSQPIIIANDPPTGKVFDSWTIDPADVTIASKKLSATVITMPDGNVTVTANYKTASGSTSSGNNTNTGTTNKPNGTGSNTVIIDKNGLSNTGVVNVTVNGSSDNFVVKINESASATEAIIKALKAEYGDISNIKYFPMDISLYDSTGKTKITDTKGLSISITLPLPDSLITYAGNNKVAGVVDEKLDKLKPRFTTIDGVSCITFTCEHFSPYVIYVETNNLSSGTVSDSTPKTGDGIHPKWFLSIGLALMAVVLFMKKDQQTAVRRVRA